MIVTDCCGCCTTSVHYDEPGTATESYYEQCSCNHYVVYPTHRKEELPVVFFIPEEWDEPEQIEPVPERCIDKPTPMPWQPHRARAPPRRVL